MDNDPRGLEPVAMTGCPGVILAGGLATRMGGGDKALLPLGDSTVLDHVIARLAPQVSAMMLNANGDARRFACFGLPVLPDRLPDHPGPLAGVLAGLDWAASQGVDRIVTVAADTPFFPRDLVARLQDAASGQVPPLVLAAAHGTAEARSRTRTGLIRHPTFGLWPVALRDDLRTALTGGLRKVMAWADSHDARMAVFNDAGEPFFNINTPEDMRRARAVLEADS